MNSCSEFSGLSDSGMRDKLDSYLLSLFPSLPLVIFVGQLSVIITST
jgi:hypothetical protein